MRACAIWLRVRRVPRSVLEIVTSAIGLIGAEDIDTLVGNPQPIARAMLSLLNRSGDTLAQKRNAWGAPWAALTQEFVFRTQPGQPDYPFPPDFRSMISDTVWDRGEYRPGIGVLSPQEWQTVKGGLVTQSQLEPYYRIYASGGERGIRFHPTPSSERVMALEYATGNWIRDANGATFDRVQADTDTPVLDDQLIEMDLLWRFKQSRGLTFAAEIAEFEMECNRRFAEDSGPRTIQLGRPSFRRRLYDGEDVRI